MRSASRVCSTILVAVALRAIGVEAQVDASPHRATFVSVAPGVRLEVLDWGGTGPALVLLAGGANTAHDFDHFAPKLASFAHVYGITRRGFGASSRPDFGYDADSLGDDVLSVLDSLRLAKPVLVGSSLGGEELSSIGSRHPTRVAGLVYLDAGYFYAFYDSTQGNVGQEMRELRRKMDRLNRGPVADYKELAALAREVADLDLPRVQRGLRTYADIVESAGPRIPLPRPRPSAISQKIQDGARMYAHIDAPVLVLYAVPPGDTASDRRASDSADIAKRAASFQRVVPSARIVLLRDANHLIWESHESDVLREIRSFVTGLPMWK